MIPLAFSTNAFKKNTFEEALQSIAAIGYSAVELMADLHHAYPLLMTPQRTAEIQTLLKQLKLTVSNINAFTLFACGDTYRPTWIEDSEAERKRRIQHTLGSIRIAADFNCKTLPLQPAAEYLEFKYTYFKNEPAIQMNCDCGHLFCCGEDPAQIIRNHGAEHIS